MFKTILAVLLVLFILISAYALITSDKDTAPYLAVVTALIPVLTLLLKQDKQDDDN